LTKKRLMLILGSSFRRNRSEESLHAIERYDGLFFRVARKYLGSVKNVDVVVMADDLTLVDGDSPIPYNEPEGDHWGQQRFNEAIVKNAKTKNEDFLSKKLGNGKHSEVFISMGKTHTKALPDLTQYGVGVEFPASGGPGPKAQALREWINRKR
jgi:hypothetical protein